MSKEIIANAVNGFMSRVGDDSPALIIGDIEGKTFTHYNNLSIERLCYYAKILDRLILNKITNNIISEEVPKKSRVGEDS